MKKPVEKRLVGMKIQRSDYAERLWQESWTYIKTIVDTVREPFLILDKHLYVIAANESFYKTFQVEQKDTENHLIYELGNGQWNIPELQKLLEDILPKNSFFKGFEVNHDFPLIGHKIMILNARQVYITDTAQSKPDSKLFPPIILLAMEDITDMMGVAEMLATHTNKFESKIEKITEKLEHHITELEKEIKKLKTTNRP